MTKAAAIQELSDEPGAEELSLLLKKALSLLSTIPSCLRVFVENEHLPMFLENFQKSATELRALTRTARELLTDQVKIDFARARERLDFGKPNAGPIFGLGEYFSSYHSLSVTMLERFWGTFCARSDARCPEWVYDLILKEQIGDMVTYEKSYGLSGDQHVEFYRAVLNNMLQSEAWRACNFVAFLELEFAIVGTSTSSIFRDTGAGFSPEQHCSSKPKNAPTQRRVLKTHELSGLVYQLLGPDNTIELTVQFQEGGAKVLRFPMSWHGELTKQAELLMLLLHSREVTFKEILRELYGREKCKDTEGNLYNKVRSLANDLGKRLVPGLIEVHTRRDKLVSTVRLRVPAVDRTARKEESDSRAAREYNENWNSALVGDAHLACQYEDV